jgi:hypothetical protein
VNANGAVTVNYAGQYLVTVNPTFNGTVTPAPGSYWEDAGASVALAATPATDFILVGWVGTGPGSYTGTNLTATITPTGPVTETATFVYYVPPIPTYALVLTPTGLPTGTVWSATIGGLAVTGSGPLTFQLANGSYTVTVGTVTPSAGVEYVPSAASLSVSVAGPTPYAGPAFTTMYLVTITGTTGGTPGPASAWVASGSTVSLTAVAGSGYTFENWSGSGTGAYSGTSASETITVTGPVSELATFVPSSSLAKSSSGTTPILGIGLLVVLLVIGLVVGLLIARSRPPSGGRATPPPEEADTSSVPVWTERAETTETPPPTGSGGDSESIYGGGSN